MNMQHIPSTSLHHLVTQLMQLQALQIWELRAQAHALAAQYPACDVYGPLLKGDSFSIEVREGDVFTQSTHALPACYSNEW